MSGINSELLVIIESIKNAMCVDSSDTGETVIWGEPDRICTEYLYDKCGDKSIKNICDDCLTGYRNNEGYASQVIIVIQKII